MLVLSYLEAFKYTPTYQFLDFSLGGLNIS